MNMRDAGDRFSAGWWMDMAGFARSLKSDCEELLSCCGMEEPRGRAGATAALHRIVDAVSGKPAQEAQVLAEEFPVLRDMAYGIGDICGEEE